ncbi:DUF3304 domain-containing protein [Collimonas humicola]|uniref:DUF3304 domain-containing protein n=1 Tax=Collimonas humicola TaxID=2825886 RepID=UPI001B8BBD1D|nr:DUF3304 domain-containing protein [Collimonas humicola]
MMNLFVRKRRTMYVRINLTLQRLAGALCCTVLMAISGCAAQNSSTGKDEPEGLVPAGQIATTISAVGHLGSMIGIPQFYVNNTWGGSSSGWGGGGGHVCCIALRDTPKQPVMVTVKWQTCDISQIKFVNDQVVDPNARCELEWHEATVPIHFDVPAGKGGGLNVHFLPGHRVEVWYTFMGAWGSTYPGPKYPRGPAPAYAPLPDEQPTPVKTK